VGPGATLEEVTEVSAPPREVGEERRTTPIEMLWDLVFAYALTQVTTLLASQPSWTRFGESMLALALVWWAWSAFVWAANAQAMSSRQLRLNMLLATVFIFLAGLALPHAFGADSTLFAVAYSVVRFLHLWLYADASRKGNASWSAISGFAVTVVIGMALLLAGSFLDGAARAALWTAALAIDYAGPAWLTRDRLRGLQRVAVAHFAERYSVFVIICLGESIVAVAVGTGVTSRLTVTLIAAMSLSLLITIGMWWTYFDSFAATAEGRLREDDNPVLRAADAYSYIHLLIVAGIIIFAVGVKLLARSHHLGAPLHDSARLALCGGVALYLLGNVGFRLRMVGELGYEKVGVAGALLAVYALGSELPAWTVAAAITVLVGVLCVLESGGERLLVSHRPVRE
jgi:low temperature requirement protein LtrA